MKFYTSVCKYFIYIHCWVKTKLQRVTELPFHLCETIHGFHQNNPWFSFSSSPPALLCNLTLQNKIYSAGWKSLLHYRPKMLVHFCAFPVIQNSPLCVFTFAAAKFSLSLCEIHQIHLGTADPLSFSDIKLHTYSIPVGFVFTSPKNIWSTLY